MARTAVGRTNALRLSNFTGGINLRDSLDQIAPNEAVDAMNVTLDERGGVQPRLGYQALNQSALAGAVDNIFFWQTVQLTIIQIGTTLYKTDDWSTITSFATFTTTARCSMCDFQGKLVVCHPVDGVFTYDNTTWTNRSTTVKGSTIAVWQNKAWVGGDPGDPTVVKWCAIGDPTTWTGTDFVNIREKDDAIITAIGVGQGMDVSGRPGLLVFKARSTYRINDSTTGEYTTLHPNAGAVSSLAVASIGGGAVGAIGTDGIYLSDGIETFQNVSQKLAPLFTTTGLNYATTAKWCAGIHNDRLVFSMTRAGSSNNDVTLEYYPVDGWFLPHSFGASAWTRYFKDTQKTYMGKPGVSSAYQAFVGGSDAGSAIASRWQSAWFELNGGALARPRHARVWGRGAFTLQVLADFNDPPGEEYDFNFDSSVGGQWGVGKWGEFLWGPGPFQGRDDIFSLGVMTHLSIRFEESTTTSGTGRNLLGDGNAIEAGPFAFYGARLGVVPLGAA